MLLTPHNSFIRNWVFFSESQLLCLADNMAVFAYNLSSGKMSFRSRDLPHSLSKVHFAVIPGHTVTVSEKVMKVWPGHMRGHVRAHQCHFTDSISDLSSVGDLLVTAGAQVTIFTLEPEACEKLKRDDDVLGKGQQIYKSKTQFNGGVF